MMWLGGGCFAEEFEAAVVGHALGKRLGASEAVNVINGVDGLGVFVAYVNNPNGDFFAFVVLVGLRAVKEDAAPNRWLRVGG